MDASIAEADHPTFLKLSQYPAYSHPAHTGGAAQKFMGAVYRHAVLLRKGQQQAGNALVCPKERCVVHMGGELPYRHGQIADHGHGQLWILTERPVAVLPVNGGNSAFGQCGGGRDPGLPVKKGRLAQDLSLTIDCEDPLRPVLRGEIAFDPSAADIIKVRGLRSLEINQLSRAIVL